MYLFFILLPALMNSFSAPNSVYLATNRFKVRSNNEVKFEQRWATRKSRIALLPGFKYFQLMKRVKGGDEKGVRTKRASLVLEVCKATEEATSEKRASKNTLVVTGSLRSRYIHY